MEKLLKDLTCISCETNVVPLEKEQVLPLLKQIPEWQLSSDALSISRTFVFKGYAKTIAFVNAVAWIAQQEMHHPDLQVSFDRCTIHYTTHATKALTQNDFICAAKINALL